MKSELVSTTIAATALFLTACSNEVNLIDNWDGRIHLSSNVVTLTRATHNLDEQIASDEKVWLYVDKTVESTTSEIYDKELTAGGDGSFTGDDDMFYPADAASISLYALHVNAVEENGTATTRPEDFPGSTELTHKVGQDQKSSNTSTVNYAKSDLLFAKAVTKTKEDVKGVSGTIELEFSHLLSKIEVVLKKGKGMDAITIDKVEILNTQLKGTFTPSKSDENSVTVASEEIGADKNAIEIDCDVTANDVEPGSEPLNEGIIIPQTLKENDAFIQVTLSTGGVLTYKLGADDNKIFAAGSRYRYTITANLTGLEVTSTISNWTHDEAKDVTGNAGM